MSRRNRGPHTMTQKISNQTLEDQVTESTTPSLPGALNQPAEPADNVKKLFDSVDPTDNVKALDLGNRPTCSTCPILFSYTDSYQCWLNPVPENIPIPTLYGCSHHPAFQQYLKNPTGLKKFETSLDPWDGKNCTCIKVGLMHHDLASTVIYQTKAGMSLVIRRSCTKCNGTGLIGGNFDKSEASGEQ